MQRSPAVLLVCLASGLASSVASAQSLEADVTQLVTSSCLGCHGDRTVTPLNLARLGFDLTDHETYGAWEKVYTRVSNGEMPPATAPQPAPPVVEAALGSLKGALIEANLAARGEQRTALRRLTRLEYGYTLQDLLGIDEGIARSLAETLPAEADSGGFDTVAANQSMSPLHVRSYLEAADRALEAAIAIGPSPPVDSYEIEYVNSGSLNLLHDCDFLACGAILKLDDGFATFTDVSSTFMFHSLGEGFGVPYPGRYRIAVDAYPYNADTPVTLTLYQGRLAGVTASLDDLIGSFDLVGDAHQTFEVTTFMRPGDLISPALADADLPPDFDNPTSYFVPEKHVRDYEGEGLVLKSMRIEGPLLESWPPPSTRQLLVGVEFVDDGELRLTKSPYDHIVDIVARFAPRAFRRPVNDDEVETYASLAEPLLAEGRPFVEAVRVPLRAILSAPPFLFHGGAPGMLDPFALATRLSYFLWRSVPDDTLFDVARDGTLSDSIVLARQVDRMLDDPKARRFVDDFAGQAFRLYELRATSPDPGLYPEYDDRLAQAITVIWLCTTVFLA